MSAFVPNMSTGPCLYCNGSSVEAPEELLRCELCRRCAHISCLRSGRPEGCLLGDNLFEYTCSKCHQSTQDFCVRAKLSTPQILLLVLYNLHKSDAYTARSGFYHWKLHIYNFINQHWKEIFGPESRKKKKKVVQASLSGQLSHYGQYFVSGYETLRDGGWYRLAVVLPPAQLIQRQMEEKRGGRTGRNSDSVKIRGRKIQKEDASRGTGINASFENVWIKEEPIERDSISSGDVSFDSLSHDDSSRGSWFTERDILKPNNAPPQALFDSDEDDDAGLVTDIKQEITIKQENVDSEMIDVGTNESQVINVKTEIPEEPLPTLKPSLFTKSVSPPLKQVPHAADINPNRKMPPKSAAQRMREYRARMSADKKKQARMKNSEQQKCCRQKWDASRKKTEAHSSKMRVMKFRLQKKIPPTPETPHAHANPSKAFGSVQSFDKAMNKTKPALRKSLRKQVALV